MWIAPDTLSASPMIAANRRLLPDPVVPDMMLSSLVGNYKLIARSENPSDAYAGSVGHAMKAFAKDRVSATSV